MTKLNSIVRFLNKELNVKKIPDGSCNGLQVRCKSEVKKIGFAVDACLSTFEKAKKAKVDLLIVHHGLKWKPQKYKDITKKRIAFLNKNKISLYGAHLPLDGHPKYGNNIQLAEMLGLVKIKKFGGYYLPKLGYSGIFKKAVSVGKIARLLNKKLKTKCRVYNFGKKKIRSIAVVSGGGSNEIEQAVKEKFDCFLFGEIVLSAYHRAKDFGLNIIIAGHYATETVGVKALMLLLKEKFKVQTVFIDNPTGL